MSQARQPSLVDRALGWFGFRASTSGYPAYAGASLTRLNADWIGTLLSPDQEKRTSLKRMRARCRQLANNNDYAAKFISLCGQNVIGPNGINLESRVPATGDEVGDELADEVNDAIEECWEEFCETVTADQRLSMVDAATLWMRTVVTDGECFVRLVRGYPYNKFKFALQFLDPDQFDTQFERAAVQGQQNAIRMSIEVDDWGRRVAYWAYEGHPSEGRLRRQRIPAEELLHSFVVRRSNDNRGLPFFYSAMERMNMLGGYEYAQLVAERLAACKMAYVTSKTGEEYSGKLNTNSGAVEMTIEPGHMDQLPDGMDIKAIDWQHNTQMEAFTQQMLRGMCAGLNVSYASLAADLRQVNFSSIRQGELEARDGWRVLQTFAIRSFYKPIFEAFLAQALATRQLKLPPAGLAGYLKSAVFQPRGWDWVDPLKDIEAAIAARGASMDTLADICGRRGKDWRDVIDQIAIENAYAKSKGVDLNFARPKPASIGTVQEETPEPGAPAPSTDEVEQEDK